MSPPLQCLDALKRETFNCMVLDLSLPDASGYSLLETLSQDGDRAFPPVIVYTGRDLSADARWSKLPILMLTAKAMPDDQARCIEAGAVDFIQKPIEAHILRGKAYVFFDLYEQRRQIEAPRDELEVAAQALRRADRHKDNFLAVLAHELRNPVAPLGGGLHLLNKDIPPDRAKDIRGRMERMLDHLTHLVDALLDVSRVSQGKIVLKTARVELGEVLRSAIDASQHHLEAAGHRFITNLPDDRPRPRQTVRLAARRVHHGGERGRGPR